MFRNPKLENIPKASFYIQRMLLLNFKMFVKIFLLYFQIKFAYEHLDTFYTVLVNYINARNKCFLINREFS